MEAFDNISKLMETLYSFLQNSDNKFFVLIFSIEIARSKLIFAKKQVTERMTIY